MQIRTSVEKNTVRANTTILANKRKANLKN
jgi:hypothetical protein